MALPSLRSLSLADVGAGELRWIVQEGEHLLVERKLEPPRAPGLGAEVAAFANTIGGWLLLGVRDDGSVEGWDPGKLDLQSYLADLLGNQVDPVPPFVADWRMLNDQRIAVVRVLETADAPVLVRGTGALYVRTPGGKRPIDSREEFAALRAKGARAEEDARVRLKALPLVATHLAAPDAPPTIATTATRELRVIVRASPLTVAPQFAAWPISGPLGALDRIAMTVLELPNDDDLRAGISPHGRGVTGTFARRGNPKDQALRIAADSGGVFAASLARPSAGVTTETVRTEFIERLLWTVTELLEGAEALGRTAVDTWITRPTSSEFEISGQERRPPRHTHCAGELTMPVTNGELRMLAERWEREFARACGIRAWEPGLADR